MFFLWIWQIPWLHLFIRSGVIHQSGLMYRLNAQRSNVIDAKWNHWFISSFSRCPFILKILWHVCHAQKYFIFWLVGYAVFCFHPINIFYLFTVTNVSWDWLQPPRNPVKDKRLHKMNEKENVKYQIQPDYAYSTHYWEGNYVICIYASSGVANNYIRGPFPPLAPPWGRHWYLCHLVRLKVERKWWKVIL